MKGIKLMKIFFVGDFTSNTGPAMANKMLRKGLSNKKVIYSDSRTKLTRVIELIFKMLICDCVCFCSYSQLNFIGIKIAKLLFKKTFYIMHGYSTYEYKINNEVVNLDKLTKIHKREKYIFENVEKIFCVSKKFMEFMKATEPDYSHKFDYNFNGIDLKKNESIALVFKQYKKEKQVVSIGGGMKRKNNLVVCQAINKLNREKNLGLEYIVIGLPYTDKEQICSFGFVKYYDNLPHDRVLEILAESHIYIQNSSFETFGLAVIEALACNCNLLISNQVGAMDVINTIDSQDLIYNVEDIDEIAIKIEYLLMKGNHEKLQQGLNRYEIDYKLSGELLLKKITDYMKVK